MLDEQIMVEHPDYQMPVADAPTGSNSIEGGLHDVDTTISLPNYVDGAPVVLSTGGSGARPELNQLMRKMFQVSTTLQNVAKKEITNEIDLFGPQEPAGEHGEHAHGEHEGEHVGGGHEGEHGTMVHSVPGCMLVGAALAPALPKRPKASPKGSPAHPPRRYATMRDRGQDWSSFFPPVSRREAVSA